MLSSWGPLGKDIGVLLGRIGGFLGCLEGLLGPSWGALGGLLGRLGAVLGASWAVLERLGDEKARTLKTVQKPMGNQ